MMSFKNCTLGRKNCSLAVSLMYAVENRFDTVNSFPCYWCSRSKHSVRLWWQFFALVSLWLKNNLELIVLVGWITLWPLLKPFVVQNAQFRTSRLGPLSTTTTTTCWYIRCCFNHWRICTCCLVSRLHFVLWFQVIVVGFLCYCM
jgi:hypothetical protein